MRNETFFSLLRQYASQARRRGRSYKDQVTELLTLRRASINASDWSDEQKQRGLAAIERAVDNEYAPFDPDWRLSQSSDNRRS